jgi:hypothetical protein
MSNTNVQGEPEDAVERIDPTTNGDIEDEPMHSPLTPAQFRSVLQQLDALGLTWTADVPPHLRAKDVKTRTAFPNKELGEIQQKYPSFPRELGNVIFYALTGSESMQSVIGSTEDADQKVLIARELVINQRPDFRSEFFFKYAIKVPYFVDLDWEVVIKAYERNVKDMPRIPYALLSLVFRQPLSPRVLIGGPGTEANEQETLTVAVDGHLVEKLIGSLTEARAALMRAQELAGEIGDKTETKERQ